MSCDYVMIVHEGHNPRLACIHVVALHRSTRPPSMSTCQWGLLRLHVRTSPYVSARAGQTCPNAKQPTRTRERPSMRSLAKHLRIHVCVMCAWGMFSLAHARARQLTQTYCSHDMPCVRAKPLALPLGDDRERYQIGSWPEKVTRWPNLGMCARVRSG